MNIFTPHDELFYHIRTWPWQKLNMNWMLTEFTATEPTNPDTASPWESPVWYRLPLLSRSFTACVNWHLESVCELEKITSTKAQRRVHVISICHRLPILDRIANLVLLFFIPCRLFFKLKDQRYSWYFIYCEVTHKRLCLSLHLLRNL